MSKKLTTEDFIKKAREIHGDRYDYSKVKYVNYKTKVEIICPEHGEFYMTPNNHLQKHGCPTCKTWIVQKHHKKDKNTFVKECDNIFNNKYNYEYFEYIKSSVKGKVICPEHGEFWITPNNHLRGYGCPVCGGSKRSNTNEFVEKSKKIHGDRYDYSKVEYVNNKTKVCIVCPEHGDFWQKPCSHLNGQGCPKCSGVKRLTTEEFINKAMEIHGDRYDYSKVEYVNNHTKV